MIWFLLRYIDMPNLGGYIWRIVSQPSEKSPVKRDFQADSVSKYEKIGMLLNTLEQYLRDFINLIYPEGKQKRSESEWQEAYIGMVLLVICMAFFIILGGGG